MKVVIVEDEAPAAQQLVKLVRKLYPETEIAGRADSIESAVRFFSKNIPVDLVFMDIQLADGLSFEIFEQVNVVTPVIFTTAFDQYTLKAFKVNSIDYLLKPIEEEELKRAIEKHLQLNGRQNSLPANLTSLLTAMKKPVFRERLMVKRGTQYTSLKTESIAYCYADDKLCFAIETSGAKHLVEDNLSQLEEQLNPASFYRINRQLLVQIDAVKKVHTWLGSRLKLELAPLTDVDTVVSRDKVNGFKAWFDGRLG